MLADCTVLEAEEGRAPLLREILAALSFALDLTEGAVPGHALRSCLLALRLAEVYGLKREMLFDLYYASLLKDVGCSSNAARMCQIVGGDDRVVKAGAKLEDWTRPHQPKLSMLQLLWTEVLPGSSPWMKAARILKIGLTQHSNNRDLITLRCDRGASIVRKIGLSYQVAVAVRHLDEHWDGSGYPGRLRGKAIPLLSRFLAVVQHLDAFSTSRGREAAVSVLQERSGRWFDPALVRIAVSLHRKGKLWEFCGEDSVEALLGCVLEREPGAYGPAAGSSDGRISADIDSICEAFAEVVDVKSPFTARHSQGVRQAALTIGKAMGLPQERLLMLGRAALLHDIGKLSVPNSILDKPGRLTEEEFTTVQGHARLSREILARIKPFRAISVIAGQHHEKLDGTGYPHRLPGKELSLESRLMAVADVYAALSEERPYRAGLQWKEIAGIMERDVPGKLDGECYEALRAVCERSGRCRSAMEADSTPSTKEIAGSGESCSLPSVPRWARNAPGKAVPVAGLIR